MSDLGNDTQERRRSQRSLLVMSLAVSWTTSGGLRLREHAQTEVAAVTHAAEDGCYRVTVEFLDPNRSFWGICFPPPPEEES